MNGIKFEWDENKNETNKKKHSISFEEASSVFYDTEALVIPDPNHSKGEERFLILGYSFCLKLLIEAPVCCSKTYACPAGSCPIRCF